MEDGLVLMGRKVWWTDERKVLILVVMEDGLVRTVNVTRILSQSCLNPCCNGRWSRT